MRSRLFPDQRRVLVRDGITDLQCIDPIWPVYTVCRLARGRFMASPDQARTDFERDEVKMYDLGAVSPDAWRDALDAWQADAASLFEPIPFVTHINCD